MNSKKLASEKRQYQAILDKARLCSVYHAIMRRRPRMENWIRDNEALESEIKSLTGDV